jgi:trimeric autotransporter adhesin
MTVLDYYKYAQLATAAYVRAGGLDLNSATYGQDFAQLANNQSDGRLPFSIAQYLFSPTAELPNLRSWTIRHYYGSDNTTDPIAKADSSGLAATLFQQGSGGEKVLAIRGTEPFEDPVVGPFGVDLLSADLGQIGALGLALSQTVSMVNLIERLRVTKNASARQISLSVLNALPPLLPDTRYVQAQGFLGVPVYFVFTPGEAKGLGCIDPGEKITVTGHSLGGELAVLAALLFPETVEPDVTVFNAAGINPDPADYDAFKSNVLTSLNLFSGAILEGLTDDMGLAAGLLDLDAQRLATPLLGALMGTLLGLPSDWDWAGRFDFSSPATAFPGLTIHNVRSEDLAPGDDLNMVASTFTGADIYPDPTDIAVEPNSHVIEPLMDALALHSILVSMNGTLGLEDIENLLLAASPQLNSSEEALTEALFKLVLPEEGFLSGRQVNSTAPIRAGEQLPISDAVGPIDMSFWTGKGDIGARDAFYDAVLRIQQAVRNQEVSLVSLVNHPVADLVDLASILGAISYRYALEALNPFAIIGENYVPHNQNGELDPYNPATRTGSLTGKWMEDRASFLFWKNIAFTADKSVVLHPDAPGVRFKDLSLGIDITARSSAPTLPVTDVLPSLIFGGDSSDSLVGAGTSDLLYGGAGTDVLRGKEGDDYLEGGRGVDVYFYRVDELLSDKDDGKDTILDIDGVGVVHVWHRGSWGTLGSAVAGDASVQLSPTQWQSADGRFTYTLREGEAGRSDLEITIAGGSGGSLRVKDFRNGDLFIDLWTARPALTFGDTTNAISGTDLGDNIVGTAVNDLIETWGGVDLVHAGGGDDLVRGGGEADFLFGEAGHDRLYGDSGRDLLFGGAGDDALYGGSGDDILEGGIGNDQLSGDSGSDILVGEEGDDTLYASAFRTLAEAILLGESEDSNGARGDWLDGGEGDDVLIGAAEHDVLLGGGGKDVIVGGAGNDTIRGDTGRESVSLEWSVERSTVLSDYGLLYQTVFQEATVRRSAAGAADRIYGGAGQDWIFGELGDDFIDGGSGHDVLFGGEGNDAIVGGEGDDILVGDNPGVVASADEGSDYLDGGEGDDTLFGNGGDDILIGGRGDDHLYGGAGRDVYLFSRRDGFDTVYDVAPRDKAADASVVVFVDELIGLGQVRFRPGSLIIDLGPADPDDPASPRDMIRFADFNVLDPYSTRVLSVIQFANGDTMTFEDVLAQGFDIDGTEGDDNGVSNPVLTGTAVTDRIRGFGGNDELQGFDGDDVLDGGAGNDRLFGGGGDDLLRGGEGADALVGDAGNDRLEGGAGRDALWGGAGDDWLAGGGDFDRLFGGAGNDTYLFDEQDTVFDVEGKTYIALADGLQAEDLELRRLIVNGQVVYQLRRSVAAGGSAFAEGMGITVGTDERLAGFVLADGTVLDREQMLRAALADGRVLGGGDGDDLLEGYGGNDLLQGGAGDDVLRGYRGNDRLEGDAGHDWLEGGAGEDWLIGGDGDDVLIGGAGSDRLTGGPGTDVYGFGRGAGRDVVADEGDADSVDTIFIEPGIAVAELALARRANGDLALTLAGGADELVVEGYYVNPANRIERIVFADGGEIAAAALDALQVPPIEGTDADDYLLGTAYGDTLLGRAGNDWLDGGGGNDRLVGGAGIDAYWLRLAGGLDRAIEDGSEASVIRLGPGLQFTDLRAVRAGDDLQLLIRGSGDGLIVQDYYATGGDWSVTALTGQTLGLPALIEQLAAIGGVATAEQAAQRFLDAARREFLTELAGFGASGDIRINPQHSDDAVIYREPPWDVTVENGRYLLNIARIAAGASDNVLDLRYSGVIVADAGDGDDLVYAYGWGYSSTGDFLYGSSGNDRIVGTFNNDVIAGGPGDDYLGGTDGNDTYLFFFDDEGFDIVDEAIPDLTLSGGYYTFAGGRYSTDTVEFGEGIEFDALDVSAGQFDAATLGSGPYARVYETLDISWAPGRGVRILLPDMADPSVASALATFSGESYGIERFVFADGSVRTLEDMLFVLQNPRRMFGTEFADTIYGDARDNQIFGLGGDDILGGGPGDDLLDGGSGNDYLFDYEGSDTYLFGRGYGSDQISEGGEGFDVLRFAEGVAPSDLSVLIGSRWNASLILAIAGTEDQVEIMGWFADAPWNPTTIEQIAFSDGTLWDRAEVLARLRANSATDQGDFLIGSQQADVVDGLEGDDAIYGLEGDDLLRGGAGNDYIEGAGGNDILLGDGGADDLEEWAGSNLLDGGDGDDYLYAEGLPSLLIGGAGDDWIDSWGANNVVAFNAGDGADLLYAREALTLSLGGGSGLEDMVLGSSGDDLVLDLGGADRIVLTRRYEADPGAWPTLRLQVIGEDIRVYDLGAVVAEYRDLAAGDPGFRVPLAERLPVHLLRVSTNLAYGGALAYAYAHTGVAFSDREAALRVLNAAEFGAQPQAIPGVASFDVSGTNAGDVLVGTDSPETLRGGDGPDWLDAGAGDDTLIGGRAADLLMGGAGADTYVYASGDGVDTIWDPSSPGESNTLVFGEGIASADITLGLGSLVLRIGNGGDAIHLSSFDPLDPYGPRDIDRFRFADGSELGYEALLARGVDISGTVGDDIVTGTSLADRIDGRAGNDTLQGGLGDDTYLFGPGSGRDLIREAASSTDIDSLRLLANPNDVQVTREGALLVLGLSGTLDRVAIDWFSDPAARIERVVFADGTVWSGEQLEARLPGAVNRAPVLNRPLDDLQAPEDRPFGHTLPADSFRDPDAGDTLRFSATLANGLPLPDWLAFDAASGTFTGTPLNEHVGTVAIRVSATDIKGLAASDDFTLTVINTNDAPVAQPDALQIGEGDSTGNIAGTLLANDSDVDVGDSLTLSAVDASATLGRLAFDAQAGWLSYHADGALLDALPAGATATDAFTYTVVDTEGALASAQVTVTVVGVNDAPRVTAAITAQSAPEDEAFVFHLPGHVFVDVDAGDTLSYAATRADGEALPAWLAFDAATQTFSGTPLNEHVGVLGVQVTATDSGGLSAATDFELSVINVNDAPEVVGAIAELSAFAGQPFAHRFSGELFRDVDAGDRLAYTIVAADGAALPAWLAFDADARVLSGLPALTDLAALDLKLVATDLAGASASLPFRLGVGGALHGGAGHDRLYGGPGDDLLIGYKGHDELSGGAGEDVLVGGEQHDSLYGDTGNDLLLGGKDLDRLYGGDGNDLLIGGGMDDLLEGGAGHTVIAFNRDDGRDAVRLGEGGTTVSLGGGIAYRDLQLRQDRDDLIVEAGQGDRLTFADWYRAGRTGGPVRLQIIAAAMAAYDPDGGDPLLDHKVETFDLDALAAAFDAARGSQPVSTQWSLMNALLDAHLAGSDSEAIGGDLAYQYGVNGSLTGIGLTAAQDVLNAPQFGSAPQALRPLDQLQQGSIRLA